MTSASHATAAGATAAGLADSAQLRASAGSAGPPIRRRASRFPGAGVSSPGAGAGRRPLVRWVGADRDLRALVADHATAVGMDLADDVAGGPAACVVTDAGALVAGAVMLAAGGAPLLVVTADPEVPAAAWRSALEAGARSVLPLPGGSEELLSRLAELARPRAASVLFGVVGGCGGAGASSFAARLAAAARGHGPVTLVDADPLGGGLDLLVEAPGADGIGWADTAGLGPDDGEALRDGLPQVDGISLLAARDLTGPGPRRLSSVLSALSPLGGTVVVDLGVELVPAAAEHLDHLLVVVPATDHAVRAAARRLHSWQLGEARVQVVVRCTGPLRPAEVGADLALPLAAAFRDSRPGTVPLLDVRRGGADRAARTLLSTLTGPGRS